MAMRYALITPAHNEAANLSRLADAVASQTQLPHAWVIVENGSTDETWAVAQDIAERFAWVTALQLPVTTSMSRGSPVVQAFEAGVAALAPLPEIVAKLDADVAFGPDHFDFLLHAFKASPRLGIAGSTCWEVQDGRWQPVLTPPGTVRGAVRAYRRECLELVLPLLHDLLRPEVHLHAPIAWDGLDQMKANLHGWETATLPDVAFRHYRPEGTRDGRIGNWAARGRAARFMGYRPLFLAARAVYRAVQERDAAAVAMIYGYVAAAVQRDVRVGDDALHDYLRSRQRLRRIPQRARGGAA